MGNAIPDYNQEMDDILNKILIKQILEKKSTIEIGSIVVNI